VKQVGDAFEMAAGALNRRPERRDIIAFRFWCLRAGGDEGSAAARRDIDQQLRRSQSGSTPHDHGAQAATPESCSSS
jgi:hypothetical protein